MAGQIQGPDIKMAASQSPLDITELRHFGLPNATSSPVLRTFSIWEVFEAKDGAPDSTRGRMRAFPRRSLAVVPSDNGWIWVSAEAQGASTDGLTVRLEHLS